MESTTHGLKDLCRTADKQLCVLQSFDLKIRSLKESVAKEIMHMRRQITYRFASKEVRQAQIDLERLERDFQYLKKPSFVPQAYESSLKEMTRRKKFRQILESDFAKLKQFVREER